MMFLLDSAFALESITLVAGTFLLAWLGKSEIKCKFSKFVGIFVVTVSFLGMACTVYYSLQYQRAGLFNPEKLIQMHGSMQGKGGMMGMEKCPMMEKMMMGAESKPARDSSEHEAHH